MSKWIEKRTRPVLPLYLAALTWPVASLILPPYRLVNLVIIAALSTVVYLVSSRFCPTRVQRVEQPYATGSENTDLESGVQPVRRRRQGPLRASGTPQY